MGRRQFFRTWTILGVAIIGLNLLPARQTEEKDYSWLFRAYPASAQGIIFCGVCCSGDTACWERRRRDFENANPPRGELTGVCYASRYRYEPDPVTRQNVQKWSTPIYTRVRFNETEVLAEDHHGRNAGFEVSVGAAWRDFILTQAPQSDGWNWTSSCISLTSPRGKEAEYWAKAQEQMAYQRVFMPTYGIADTPEERALEAKLTAERKAKEAEAARQAEIKRKEAEARAAEAERKRLAAEAARKAELARIEAERQKKVDAIAQQLGPGKREAAEKLQKMNDELAALRPKPKPKPAEQRQCTNPAYTTKWTTGPGLTEFKDAQAEYAGLAAKACQGRGGKVSPIQCGNVITVLGTPFTSCQATISCAAYTQKDCGSRVTPQ
jgi:hypothetical protein